MAKVILVGLDCAEPTLVFDRWRDDLPNLRRLTAAGLYGPLRSCDPPITVPAWTCMMTSRDPGELGIYGFRNRKSHDYGALGIASSLSVQEDRVWDVLGRAGRSVVVVGVPPTYPVQPVNGHLISCFLTPNLESVHTYPAGLRDEIRDWVGEYLFDVEGFRTDDKPALLSRIYDMTRKRFQVLRRLIREKPWDFFMFVEMGVDRIHHGFWKFHDPGHVKHERGNPYRDVIRDYYRYLDGEIGELLALTDEETVILVVSDHGAKKMDGGVCINEWLVREKFLKVESYPKQLTSPSQLEFDWGKTLAWGEGGYYGRIYLNVRGREPKGVIAPSDVPRVCADLKAGLEEMKDEYGKPLGTRVHFPADLYREVRGTAPDLIVYFGDLDWRSVGTLGHGAIHTRENDTGPDDANHDTHGIFIMARKADWDRTGEGARPGAPLPGLTLYDVAPTLLRLFGLPVPAAMQGKPVSLSHALPFFG
ncbi:MAG: alkaline phosphatase family protein [Candidatus Tectomicrobia bacterium]|nr:alkaline phosphatase family protein [Candidatus Tectomicrobia bacterium]